MDQKHMEGYYLFGILKGCVVERSKKTDSNGNPYVNRMVGIARTFTDRFGTQMEDVVSVSIMETEFPVIQAQVEKWKGLPVRLNVFCQASVGGKNGAWLRVTAVKDAVLELQTDVKDAKKVVNG